LLAPSTSLFPSPNNFLIRLGLRLGTSAWWRPVGRLTALRRSALRPQNQAVCRPRQHAGTYRYYLTRLGRAAIAAACSFTELRIIPVLAASM